jgi:uncharacterized protein
MRGWLAALATLAVTVFGASAASAQTPLDCSVAPQSVCEDKDLQALEGERAALIQQLTGLDPQNAALANEQTWIAGLGACGEDVECYRTAYLNHNQALRQSVAALPGAPSAETPLEAPADAPTVEEQIAIDEVQAERLREAAQDARETPDDGQAFVASGLPGWGFFTAIGVTLFIFWWLMRALGRHRRELREDEARARRAA